MILLTFVGVHFDLNSFEYSKSLQCVFSLNALLQHLGKHVMPHIIMKTITNHQIAEDIVNSNFLDII